MVNQDYFCTFAYYDSKGRRLSVFCRYISPTEAEITTITCSRADPFNKKYAHAQYQLLIDGQPTSCKPVVTTVAIQPEEREMKTLIRFCRQNYYMVIDVPFSEQMLATYDEFQELININQLTSCQ